MARRTEQRSAIRHSLEEADRPLSVKEILVEAQKSVPGLGIATVYRNIRNLLDDGWLTAVELPGEASRYELAGKPHHHHFHCRACGRVFEAPACPWALIEFTPAGFELEDHEIILYGRCMECVEADIASTGAAPPTEIASVG